MAKRSSIISMFSGSMSTTLGSQQLNLSFVDIDDKNESLPMLPPEGCSFRDIVDPDSEILEITCEVDLRLSTNKDYDIFVYKGNKTYKLVSTGNNLHLAKADIEDIAGAFEKRINELESFISKYLFKGRPTIKSILENPLEYEYDSSGNLISVRNNK